MISHIVTRHHMGHRPSPLVTDTDSSSADWNWSDLAPVFVMNIYFLLKFNHVLGTAVRPHGPVAVQGTGARAGQSEGESASPGQSGSGEALQF